MLFLKLNRFRVLDADFLLLYCILIFIIKYINGAPFLDSDIAIKSEIIDPFNRTVWAMFNLTDAQVNRMITQNSKANNKTTELQGEANFENIKEYRINDIRHRLESALKVGSSEENQEHPLHEMAGYPICSSDSNEASWLHDNNVTIRFADSLFEPKSETSNLNVDSAVLRLYKYNPNNTENPNQNDSTEDNGDDNNNKAKRCANNPLLDSQIRVTVSIVQQLRRNRRERKKRICNTIMMNVSKTGWIEIDITRAIYIWENVERQQQTQQQQQQQSRQSILVGWLLIEVHDEEERPLKPGLYFQPPKCDQADYAVPWNYYRQNTAKSNFPTQEVPRYPRLDVKLIGYASFAPKAFNSHLHEKLRENFRHQMNNNQQLQKLNSMFELDNETTLPSSIDSTVIMPTTNNLLNNLKTTVEENNEQHYRNDDDNDDINPHRERDVTEHTRHHRRTHHNGHGQHNYHHQHHHHSHNHRHNHQHNQHRNEHRHHNHQKNEEHEQNLE